MLSQLWSATTIGIDALPVEIETNIDFGVPKYTVVGLPDVAVRESRDRIQAAIRNSGFKPPRGVITVNLAPADVRKEGTAFDLPIALGLLAASELPMDPAMLRRYFVLGELALDGQVRPVRGVLPMAVRARDEGMEGVVVPYDNGREAAVVEGIRTFAIRHMHEAVALFAGNERAPRPIRGGRVRSADEGRRLADMADVKGQESAKRALEVAAAGGHNVLMIGPPGAGKTMLARRVPSILPPLETEEALETTKVHSVGGRLTEGGLVTVRPFRAPHHTISDAGLCGGGGNPKPGEISLAHNGVLFLDELPEFKRRVLEVLRQPLEEGRITISRAHASVVFPARFMLIASMNPCPCGNLNNPTRPCVCPPGSVQRYLARVSGPLLDRIDLHLEVRRVPVQDLSEAVTGTSSADIRARVMDARAQQRHRFGASPTHCNASMIPAQVRRHCRLDDKGRNLIRSAVDRLGLSARGFDRILKVARTVADLASSERIRAEHVAEAIQYRSLDRDFWTV